MSDDVLTVPKQIIAKDAALMVALHALGKAEITTATDRLTPLQEIVFAAALYLLIERPKAVGRTALAEVLWPGADDQARQHRLRQTLLQLKRVGIPLQTTRESVCIPCPSAESDLDVLFVHGAGDISRIETFQFLPGYAPRFSHAFSEWLDVKRAEVSSAATRVLLNEIRQARNRGDWLRVERVALKCMDVDPFNEEAVLARAEASAMRGAKREAVSIIDQYVAELGPGTMEIKLPATLMRKRIAERVPESALFGRTENIFVGREPDMQVLITLLNEAREARGRCCLLWGDAGIGKSRLASELGRFGELQGVRMRRVACRRGDVQRPLSVFVEMIPQLLDMRGALGCSAETISDLQRLTEFDLKSPRLPQTDMDPQSIFEAIRAAIFDLIDAVSEEQPLMLLIEDVQWLDAASARILGQLADLASTKRVLLVFTSRIRENPLLDACTRAGLVTHHVQPFDDHAAAQLVNEMFALTNEKIEEDFLVWCRDIGEGNPFFLHELVKQWMETRQRHVVPPSITSVIRDRVSRLSETATQVLQACSILGEHATLPRIERMLGHEPYRLLAALQELAKSAMLSEERQAKPDSEKRLRIRHDLVSDVVTKELDRHSRMLLHRRAGEVLESEFGEGPQQATLVWACADHWQTVGESDRAYQLAKRCAEHLMAVGLPGDAADAFEVARRFCRTKAEEAAMLDMQIGALERARRWSDVKRAVLQIQELKGIKGQHDDYELKYVDAMWRSSLDFSEIVALAKPCVETTLASPQHRVKFACLTMKMAGDQGRLDLITELFQTIAPLLQSPDVPETARCEAELIYHSTVGNVSDARRCALRFATELRKTADVTALAIGLRNASIGFRLSGEFAMARALLREAVEASLSKRNFAFARSVTQEIVRMYLTEGNVTQAREELDRFANFAFPIDDPHSAIDFAYVNARVCIEEKDFEQAETHCRQLLKEIDRCGASRRAAFLATIVRLGAELGRSDEGTLSSICKLEELHTRYRGSGFQDFETHALVVGLCSIGETKKAQQLFWEYVDTYRRESYALSPPLLDVKA